MVNSSRDTVAYQAEVALRTLFKRCVDCPDVNPTCPPCPNGQICSLVPTDCKACAYATCVVDPSASSGSNGPNVGAIAGGVVGGVVAIAIAVFLVWFLWIRKRRAQQEVEAEEWHEDEIAQQKAAFQSMVHDAASTRTRASFAHSFMSRASNIIPIAFIPGVTTRNGSSRNSMLVPPVPALGRNAPRSPLTNQDDAIYFGPGDISTSSMIFDSRRDTQYSTSSRATSRVASSIYHDSFTMQPAPLAQAARGVMPRMISVRSVSTNNQNEVTSPAGSSDYSPNSPENQVQVLMPGQGSAGAQSGSLRTHGSFGKAHQVMLSGKAKSRFPVRTPLDAAGASEGNAKHTPVVSSPLRDPNGESEDSDDEFRGQKSLLKITPAPLRPGTSPYLDSPPDNVGPTSAPRPNPYASMSTKVSTTGASTNEGQNTIKRGKSLGGLSAVIEEATRKASHPPLHAGLGGKREPSPFDDSNRIDEE